MAELTANDQPRSRSAMPKKLSDPGDAAKLRRRAEASLRKRRRSQQADGGRPRSADDTKRLLQELQVHQIELEMQNIELREARDRMEGLVEKYTDLYDFAPVGYFSLDDQGRILEVNLSGAVLLGVERSRLIHQPLLRFVVPASRPTILAFLEKVFAEPGKVVCEVALLTEEGVMIWADLQAVSAAPVTVPRPSCRVAVSDITALKRVEDLAAANRELTREIGRRQAVEEALKKSEQQQIKLLEQSRDMQEQLRHLSHQLLQAQEDERKRISRELHDQIVQTLLGIHVQLETLARDAATKPKGLKGRIENTQRLVAQSVEIVHRFARELRPAILDDLGLIATLHSHIKDFSKRTGIHVALETVAGVDRLNSVLRTVLYRVAQSALANVAQHAQASRVEVRIEKLPGAVQMEIKDNGRSFAVEQVLHAKKNKRLGLLGMRERVEMVGGSFVVESAPGQGTTIRARIPGPVTPK
jgi:PAS domain S-box-containing protein